MTRVTKTLEESKGVTAVRFDSNTGLWTISTDRTFQPDEVSRRVRVAGEEHSRELQQPNDPAWIVRWIAPPAPSTAAQITVATLVMSRGHISRDAIENVPRAVGNNSERDVADESAGVRLPG